MLIFALVDCGCLTYGSALRVFITYASSPDYYFTKNTKIIASIASIVYGLISVDFMTSINKSPF
jgi:hypothetical protein